MLSTVGEKIHTKTRTHETLPSIYHLIKYIFRGHLFGRLQVCLTRSIGVGISLSVVVLTGECTV